MKTITTRIPNKESKRDYILMHVNTYKYLLQYLDEIPRWIKEDGLEDWVSEVHNELERLRRI